MTEEQEREFAGVRGLPWMPAFQQPYVAPPGEMTAVSLRDYFAAKALGIAFESLYETWKAEGDEFNFCDEVDTKILAEHAYLMADAMLKVRDATP
jgi:hypothetical protein